MGTWCKGVCMCVQRIKITQAAYRHSERRKPSPFLQVDGHNDLEFSTVDLPLVIKYCLWVSPFVATEYGSYLTLLHVYIHILYVYIHIYYSNFLKRITIFLQADCFTWRIVSEYICIYMYIYMYTYLNIDIHNSVSWALY